MSHTKTFANVANIFLYISTYVLIALTQHVGLLDNLIKLDHMETLEFNILKKSNIKRKQPRNIVLILKVLLQNDVF
jgi:hypothetical protein